MKKSIPVQLPWPLRNLQNHRLTIKETDMIYLLTYVAKTQDVPLDGTIFFDNTDQKDKTTVMNKNITLVYRVILSLQKPTEIKFYNKV